MNSTAGITPDATLIDGELEFRKLVGEYDRVTDWDSVESTALVRRLDEVKELILRTPPMTLVGAAAKLRMLLELLKRDWDDYLAETGIYEVPGSSPRQRWDVPMLRQVVDLLEREAQR